MTMMRSSGAPEAGGVGTLAGDGDSASVPDPEWVGVRPPAESLGQYLKRNE